MGDGSQMTWGRRLEWLWRFIRGKQPYTDQLCLSANECRKLSDIAERKAIEHEKAQEEYFKNLDLFRKSK